jgi:hypothetical protein
VMKEAPGSSETSVLTRATRRNNPEDTIHHNRDKFIGVICITIYNIIKNSVALSPQANYTDCATAT